MEAGPAGPFPGMFCQDKDFIRSIRDSFLKNPAGFQWSPVTLSYTLKTGANWSGPIGDFRLVVDKGSPRNVVSFCGTAVKKISPTRFEMRKYHLCPTRI